MVFNPRVYFVLASALLLSACALPARLDFAQGDVAEDAYKQTVYIASQRGELFADDLLGEDRIDDLSFMKVDIAMPTKDNRNPGETRNFKLDPQPTQYANRSDFVNAVWRSRGENPNTVFLFVHGFNTTDAEATVRLAQLQEDYTEFSKDYPSVLFTWQSAGRTFGYLYDRDSALFARNALEELILSISDRRNREVIILAHSMGSFLTMEVLQKMNDKGDINIEDKIAGVVLIAPDIDPDVFESQVKSMERVPTEFAVLSAPQDRTLRASGFLRGNKKRLGQLSDNEGCQRFAEYDVKFMRVGRFDDGRTFAHNIPFISNQAISQITHVFGETGVQQRWFRPGQVPELDGENDTEATASGTGDDLIENIDVAELEARIEDPELKEAVMDAVETLEEDPENLRARCIIATAAAQTEG